MSVQLIVAAGNRTGQVIPVAGEKFIIGRAADCHLQPSSELISRYHCAILVGNDVVVRDLGSRNGVRLNGEKISAEKQLTNGDKLVVGPLEFYIKITGDAHEPMDHLHTQHHHSEESDGRGVEPAIETVVFDHMKPME